MTQEARALRRLYRRKYIIGFLLLACLACASLYINFEQTSRQGGRAELVNLASSQKALSQRISFFSNALVTTTNPGEREVIRSELEEAIGQMRRAHEILSAQEPPSGRARGQLKTVNEIYFNEYAPFDEDVRSFLKSAETLLQTPAEELSSDSMLLKEINLLGMHTIMQTHDVITRIIAYETEQEIVQAKTVQSILTSLILVLLVAESFIIFEPMGKRIEDSLRKVEISEGLAQEEAKRANAAHDAKSNFLRVMSHELRTPLNAVIGMSNLLKGTALNTLQHSYVHHIADAGQHMLSLANDILTVNQHALGKLRFDMRPTDLAAEIDNVMGLMAPKAKERGLALSFTPDDSFDGRYEIDRQRFRQVILNLVGNAVKYTEKGGVRVSACAETDEAKADIEIRVIDTGVGVDPAKHEKIFEEFEQADAFSERAYGGAGLGLSISRKIIEGLGGKLYLEESSSEGSTFVIKLRLMRCAGSAETPHVSTDEAATLAEFDPSQTTVLVADDNLPNRMIAAAYLKKAGYKVVFAENGKEAVTACDIDGDVDMIFMDIEMPVMDGVAATKALRMKHVGGKHTPIVALTAHVLPEDCDNLLSEGFDEVLRKPATETAIIDCVRRYTAQSAAA